MTEIVNLVDDDDEDGFINSYSQSQSYSIYNIKKLSNYNDICIIDDDIDDNNNFISTNSKNNNNNVYYSQESNISHSQLLYSQMSDTNISIQSNNNNNNNNNNDSNNQSNNTNKRKKKSNNNVTSLNKEEREINNQILGKYKRQEVSLILSNTLQDNTICKPLFTLFNSVFSSYSNTISNVNNNSLFSLATQLNNNTSSNNTNNNSENIFYSESITNNLIRWTYRPKALGGYCNIDTEHSIVLDFTVIIYPNNEFIRLSCLPNSNNNDNIYEYNELGNALSSIRDMLPLFDKCPSNTRVAYILINIDNEILKLKKDKNKNHDRSHTVDIDDIEAYLLHKHKLEIVRLKNMTEVCEYLLSCTKVLGDSLYRKEISLYDKANKVSKQKGSNELSDKEAEVLKCQQTWMSMLQMIPNLSREKARNFVTKSEFTCPRRLYEAYQNATLSQESKISLVQSLFGKANTDTNNNRAEVKISRIIYQLFNEENSTAELATA